MIWDRLSGEVEASWIFDNLTVKLKYPDTQRMLGVVATNPVLHKLGHLAIRITINHLL
jgi:hypothetical protein